MTKTLSARGRPLLQLSLILEVLKISLILFLAPPSPGGSRGRVRTAIVLRES